MCERVGGVLGVVLLGDEQINDLQELGGSRKLISITGYTKSKAVVSDPTLP